MPNPGEDRPFFVSSQPDEADLAAYKKSCKQGFLADFPEIARVAFSADLVFLKPIQDVSASIAG